MFGPFRNLDRVLRGEATRVEDLREGRLEVPARGLALAAILLGMFYGACMGSYGIAVAKEGAWLQIVSSMLKVPLLFVLTLLVTFPSLYVFNALVGSRLSLVSMLRLLVAGIAVMLALLASFGTIVAFFGFTSTSYDFMKVLNVIVFAVSGVLGLSFLLQTLHRLSVSMEFAEWSGRQAPAPVEAEPAEEAFGPVGDPPLAPGEPQKSRPWNAAKLPRRPGALDRAEGEQIGASVKSIFRIWVLVFGLVGAQMSWILRPFIGSYDGGEFVWFRPRGGNFFESVWNTLQHLFS